jgi:glycosyltransferase involved in cell wall biosynthesis
MAELSILIPARNEMWLRHTIEDILQHMEGNSEIICVLDGTWAEPQIVDHPKVILVHYSESIGQRAATNVAARISQAKYVMKVDAHCAFDQGFDVKLMENMQDDWTVAPIMRNLHVFNWICPEGHRRYQSPSGPCKECGKPTEMEVVWIAKSNPQSWAYLFDPEPHFQYWNQFKKRPEGKGSLTESMSLQGSCFLMTREKFFELNICDEEFGSWGSQGIEVACKTWLSGGRVLVNHKTWYAHLFRTQSEIMGMPWKLPASQIEHAKECARNSFFNGKWSKQIHPLSWLLEKFWPVPGWTEVDLAKLKGLPISEVATPKPPPLVGIVYYTDNRLDPKIMSACQKQLKQASHGFPIVSVSLQPIDLGANITLSLERGYLTMFKQILAGLEALPVDVVFFAEHDVLYDSSHFDFIPSERDTFYYNMNSWIIRYPDGHALYYDHKSTSGICVYRDAAITHYRERIAMVEKEGYSTRIGFEPMTHGRIEWHNQFKAGEWYSNIPNLDIKHGQNLTPARWSQDQFRNKRNCKNWKESDIISGWGLVEGRLMEILEGV